MTVHVRVCRDCGEEYRPGIVRCADCGGELEDRFLDDEPPEPSGPAEPEPPAGPDLSAFRPIFASRRAADLVPLAEHLRDAEIGFHLVEQPAPEGAPSSFSLLVHESDEAGARRVLTPLLVPHVASNDVHDLEAHFEEGRGYVRCPACGTEQAAGAVECHECGLALGDMEAAVCPRCGGPLPEAGAACPACGGAPAV
jgi:hypothetical protein